VKKSETRLRQSYILIPNKINPGEDYLPLPGINSLLSLGLSSGTVTSSLIGLRPQLLGSSYSRQEELCQLLLLCQYLPMH